MLLTLLLFCIQCLLLANVNTGSANTLKSMQIKKYGFDETKSLKQISILREFSFALLKEEFKDTIIDTTSFYKPIKDIDLPIDVVTNYIDKQQFGFTQESTLIEASEGLKISPIKLRELMNTPESATRLTDEKNIRELGYTPFLLSNMKYQDPANYKPSSYRWVIIIGSIFFACLILLLILKQINANNKANIMSAYQPPYSKDSTPDSDAEIAAIMAVHLYQKELNGNLHKGSSIQQNEGFSWRFVAKSNMPNSVYYQRKKR